jgi:pimeloyl-ACP methyl ester carboxylesterase
MTKKIRKIVYPILFIFSLYIISGIILSKKQEKIIFKPEKLPENYQFHFQYPFKELNIPLNESDQLNAVLLKAGDPKGIVIYFHGNKGNITTYAGRMPVFLKNHYNVLIMDYPGFGKSTGSNTEEALYHDALLMYQLAKNYFQADSIIVYGQKLGTAMASYVASRRRCKALILESPFYSMDVLAKHYFPIYPVQRSLKYHFPVYHYIQRTAAPVFIFYKAKDRSRVKRLEPLLKPGDQFMAVSADDQDLIDQPLYQKVLDSIFRK